MTTPTDDKPPSHVRLVTDPEEHVAPPRNLLHLPVITTLNMDPDAVLEEAKGRLECVVVVGYEKGPDGDGYFASSVADAGTIAWLLQRGIWMLNQKLDKRAEEGGDDGGQEPVA